MEHEMEKLPRAETLALLRSAKRNKEQGEGRRGNREGGGAKWKRARVHGAVLHGGQEGE
jgi:hypothetical protein